MPTAGAAGAGGGGGASDLVAGAWPPHADRLTARMMNADSGFIRGMVDHLWRVTLLSPAALRRVSQHVTSGGGYVGLRGCLRDVGRLLECARGGPERAGR